MIPNIERRWRNTESDWMRDELSKYQAQQDPLRSVCHGQRLKPEALAVKIAGKNISEVCEFSIKNAGEWFTRPAEKSDSKKQNEIAARILKEINDVLGFLNNVGLEYLALSRAVPALCRAAKVSVSGWLRKSAPA